MNDTPTNFRELNHNASDGTYYNKIEYQQRNLVENSIYFAKKDTVRNSRQQIKNFEKTCFNLGIKNNKETFMLLNYIWPKIKLMDFNITTILCSVVKLS